MRKILLSLLTIGAVGALATTATRAVFSSTATVTNNTFATGTLEIRVNGQPTIAGFSVTAMAPGDCTTGQFGLNNYGSPYFAGPSNLTAEELVMKVSDAYSGTDVGLFNALTLKVESNRGWSDWETDYNGALSGLVASESNLFGTRWTELAPGDTQDVRYTVCLPDTAGDEAQGKSTSFDFIFTGYTPDRTP